MKLRKAEKEAAEKFMKRVMRQKYNGWDKPSSLYAGFCAGVRYMRRQK